ILWKDYPSLSLGVGQVVLVYCLQHHCLRWRQHVHATPSKPTNDGPGHVLVGLEPYLCHPSQSSSGASAVRGFGPPLSPSSFRARTEGGRSRSSSTNAASCWICRSISAC